MRPHKAEGSGPASSPRGLSERDKPSIESTRTPREAPSLRIESAVDSSGRQKPSHRVRTDTPARPEPPHRVGRGLFGKRNAFGSSPRGRVGKAKAFGSSPTRTLREGTTLRSSRTRTHGKGRAFLRVHVDSLEGSRARRTARRGARTSRNRVGAIHESPPEIRALSARPARPHIPVPIPVPAPASVPRPRTRAHSPAHAPAPRPSPTPSRPNEKRQAPPSLSTNLGVPYAPDAPLIPRAAAASPDRPRSRTGAPWPARRARR